MPEFTFKPEVGIGDLVAACALLISLLALWVAARTKGEQRRTNAIARFSENRALYETMRTLIFEAENNGEYLNSATLLKMRPHLSVIHLIFSFKLALDIHLFCESCEAVLAHKDPHVTRSQYSAEELSEAMKCIKRLSPRLLERIELEIKVAGA